MLSVGATVTLVPEFEPGLVLSLLERTKATILGSVPTMQLMLLEHPDFDATDLGALRLVMSGGSVVPPSLIERVERSFGVTVVNAYGQSESPNALMTSPDDDARTKAETIGRPLEHREAKIVGAGGETVPFDAPGELVMRSPMTMDGYVGVPRDIEAATLTVSGWLHTGDLCSMDDRGVVRIHGRLREVIIRGGENVYPAEVEAVVLRHPGVADAAVIGEPDDRWGEVPVCVYRPAAGADPDPSEMERYARQSLASFKVPRRWVRVDEFPLTASGKVKKHELRERLHDS
jgi:fatty-acyl-CoA synthase